MNYKVAILIDGGFYTQRFKELNKPQKASTTTTTTQQHQNHYHTIIPQKKDVERLITDIMIAIQKKTGQGATDFLYRAYWYDCMPFKDVVKSADGKSDKDYGKGKVYADKLKFINSLKEIDQFALRLGQLSFTGWKLDVHNPTSPPKPDFRQKGVDMKIGLDMAWMASNKTVQKIVLVTGDSDFISPIKFVRREGLLVYLYPMQQRRLKADLKEHCDFIL